MRNEKQVLKQILDFANNDVNIRAVIMNGSRVNPNIKKDIFCDYDIVYVVNEPKKYSENRKWISYFGDLVILQFNRAEQDPEKDFIFLMQFQDGVRIDLTFVSTQSKSDLLEDSLTLILLDKDKRFPAIPEPNESTYITKKPTVEEYDLVVNEFWWVSTYVAKSLWRDEIVSAKYLYEVIVRDCLNKMVTWHIASQHDWEINVGKFGKKFGKLLPPDLWQTLLATYKGIDEEETWQALFTSGDIMRKLSLTVAEKLGYTYPIQDDERVSRYLRQVKNLPKDAKSFD